MATIKSYTDLEQSKKLIELGLNVNTSDMYYSYDYNIDEYEDDAQVIPQSEEGQHFSLFPEDIPAWSLTALIELMGECKMERTPLDQSGEFTHSFVDDYFNIHTYEEYDIIDAAVEMVIKLKEKDLI